jgi:hypothetical protein
MSNYRCWPKFERQSSSLAHHLGVVPGLQAGCTLLARVLNFRVRWLGVNGHLRPRHARLRQSRYRRDFQRQGQPDRLLRSQRTVR